MLLLLGGAGVGAYLWSQTQYYVGAEGGSVAIFRGLSQDVGPISTSRLYRTQDIALKDLPAYQRERVESAIATSGLADARRIVRTLQEQAERCREQAATEPAPTGDPAALDCGSGA